MQNNIIIKDIAPFKIVNIKIKDANHWALFRCNCTQAYIDFYKEFFYNNGTEKSFAKVDSAFGEIYRFLKSEYSKRGNEEKADNITKEIEIRSVNNLNYCERIESKQIANFPIPNLEYFDKIKNYMIKYKNVTNNLEVNKMKFKYIQDFCNGITSLCNAVENCVNNGGTSA